MKGLRRFNFRVPLLTQILVPVILLGLVVFAAGIKVLQSALEKQIHENFLSVLENFGSELKYQIVSDYRNLFLQTGTDSRRFDSASRAEQSESLVNFVSKINSTKYKGSVLQGDRILYSNMEIPGALLEKSRKNKESTFIFQNYFVYHYHFYPWNWDILVFHDNESSNAVIHKNAVIVGGIIFLLLTGITFFLALILQRVVKSPIKTLLESLKKIEREQYDFISLESSREFGRLAAGINHMSQVIESREKQILSEKQKVQKIMDSQSSIVILSTGTEILHANQAFFQFFHEFSSLEDFKLRHSCICDFFERVDEPEYVYKKEQENWIEVTSKSLHPKKAIIKRGDKTYTFNVVANYLHFEAEEFLNVVTLTDISELEEYRLKLEESRDNLVHQLYTDSLTGLPNRLALLRDLENMERSALAILNIDSFQEINDFFGTKIGDKLLRDLGERVGQHLAKVPGAKLYKLSSDEYAVHFSEIKELNGLNGALAAVSEFMNEQVYNAAGNEIRMNLSAGASLENNAHELFTRADIALKLAREYNSSFRVYDESQKSIERYHQNIELTHQLKKAIEENRIILYFQPIVSLDNPDAIKHEVLVRLVAENGDVIGPNEFLEVAKRIHIYDRITEIVLTASIKYFSNQPGSFTINISGEDIFNHRVRDMIIQKVRDSGIADKIIFELTESEEIKKYEEVNEFIRTVKAFGARIAIDDFGSGYSNFQHILNLRADFLKIDGSLIQGILKDKTSLALVETIVAFAKKAGIATVAEYIDSQELFNKAKELEINFVQGFFISRPSPSTVQ